MCKNWCVFLFGNTRIPRDFPECLPGPEFHSELEKASVFYGGKFTQERKYMNFASYASGSDLRS